MNFLNIIFMVSCYPIIFLMYYIYRGAKDKNGWCFGATLSKAQKNDPAVAEIDKEYQKILKTSMIVLAIIPLVTFFIPYMSIGFTIWMVWICVICFAPMLLFARTNKKIQELKQKKGWNQVSEVAYTDMKIASVPRRVKFITFLPPLVLSAVAAVLSFVLFKEAGLVAFRICVVTFAAMTLLFYLAALWTDKQKITVVSDDSDTNMNYARAKKQAWKNFWLVCTWLHTLFTWGMLSGMFFRAHGMSIIIWGTTAYGAILIFVMCLLVKKIHQINKAYEGKRTLSDAADDDRNWLYGMMYYNKNDKHFMVENRMGTGTAVNLATKGGKGMYIFASLMMLIIPVSCIWIIMLDFTPISTEVVDNAIVCTHLSEEYEIPLDDIVAYSVITELPEMTKVSGTGMNHVLSGRYEIYREGMFEAFLNPKNDLFIKILTEEETYYISGVDDKATEDIIEAIQSYIY